jgi:hypothetical protein
VCGNQLVDCVSFVSMKYDANNGALAGLVKMAAGVVASATKNLNPVDVQAQVLSDGSYFALDAPDFLPLTKIKISRLRMRYVLGISPRAPHHIRVTCKRFDTYQE